MGGVSPAGGKYVVDKSTVAIAKLAWLLREGGLPESRRAEKLLELRELLGEDQPEVIGDEELYSLSKRKGRCINAEWRSPEAHVVSRLQLTEGLGCDERAHDFVVAWRNDFVSVVQPRFLPP